MIIELCQKEIRRKHLNTIEPLKENLENLSKLWQSKE
jgi:hypothetical protein